MSAPLRRALLGSLARIATISTLFSCWLWFLMDLSANDLPVLFSGAAIGSGCWELTKRLLEFFPKA